MVNGEAVRRPSSWAAPTAGGTVWAAAVLLAASTPLDLTIFQVFLLLGVLVVVPLGLPLADDRSTSAAPWVAVAAATLVVASIAMPFGAWSALLTTPWLVCTVALAVRRAVPPVARRSRRTASLADGIEVVACGWLVVGAVSLTLSRAQLTVLAVPAELVELGAVHFSYAGFAAATIAGQLLRRRPSATTTVAALATVGGAFVIAVGHLTVRPLELAGAVSMTVGLAVIGMSAWSLAPPRTATRLLLRLAALSVVVPMALALHYAWSLTTGSAHLPLATIAAVHGTLNAVGFSIGDLVAFRLLATSAPPAIDHRGTDVPVVAAPVQAGSFGSTSSVSELSPAERVT